MGLKTPKQPECGFNTACDRKAWRGDIWGRNRGGAGLAPAPLLTGRKISLWVLALIFANPLFATDDEDKSKLASKKTPEATVTITAEAYTVEIAKTPNPVVVLDAEALSKIGSAALDKALQQAKPGVFWSYGAYGMRSVFNINGSRSQDTIVLLDGIRITGDSLSLDLSGFTLTGVNRLEVLSGPASTLYGTDAHGGVISLSSGLSAAEGISGYLSLQGSTLGQTPARMMASYGWGDGWLQATGDLDRSPQPIETKNPYRQASGHVGFGQQFGGNTLLTVNHRRQYTGTPLPYTWDQNAWSPPIPRTYTYEREYLRWQDITTASVKTDFTANLYGELNLGNVNQEGFYPNDTRNPFKSELKRNQGNALVAWKQDKGSLTLLADYISDEFHYATDFDNKSKATHTAFALEGSIEALPILRFVASVRQQSDKIESDTVAYDQWGSLHDASNNTISQVTWKAGANLLLPSGFRAYLNTGTAFNSPSLYQLGYNQSLGFGDPGNEHSRSILAGVGYEQAKWWVRADASRINYDVIVDMLGAWGTDPYGPLYDIRVQSLEVSGGTRGNNWNAQLYVRSQEGRRMNWAEERQLQWFQNRPFFSTGLRADWVLNQKVELGLNAYYMGHRYVYSSDFGGYWPDKTHYIDVTVYAVYRWNDALTFTFRGERLFQDGISREDWEALKDIWRNNMSIHSGYPSHGRALSLEMRYKF